MLFCNITSLTAVGLSSLIRDSSVKALDSTFYLPFKFKSEDADVANTYLTVLRAGKLKFSPLMSPLSQGTWRLTTAAGDVGIWIHLYQTEESAKCLQAHFTHSPCKDLGPSEGGPGQLVLMPIVMHIYSCFGGVETQALDVLSSYTNIAKQILVAPKFLGFSNQTFDDVYAIYTGVLGSVFSAAAAWIAALAVAFVIWAMVRAAKASRAAQHSKSGEGGDMA